MNDLNDTLYETLKLAGTASREAYQEGYREGYNAGLKYAQNVLAEFLKGLEPSIEQHPNYCHEHGGHLRESPACELAQQRSSP